MAIGLSMILNFYIVAISLLGIGFLYAWSTEQKKLVQRGFTLLVLIHIFCLAISGGLFVFTGAIIIMAAIIAFELARLYDINAIIMSLTTLIIVPLLLPFIGLVKYILPIFILFTASSFLLKEKTIVKKSYFFLFYIFFLIPCALSIIGIYRLFSDAVIAIFLLLQLNDSFGLIFGKRYGKRKVFKKISPNKTIAGYLFGGAGLILGILFLHAAIPVFKHYSLTYDVTIIAYMFIMGNAGDLFFSFIKRKMKVKDFSNFLPGHGGVLDRFDNFLFVSPLLFFFIEEIGF